MRELVTIGQGLGARPARAAHAGAAPYDLVIVDAPATGHGLGDAARAGHLRATSPRVGPIRRQAERIDAFLARRRAHRRARGRAAGGDAGERDARPRARRCADELGHGDRRGGRERACYPERFRTRRGGALEQAVSANGSPARARRCGAALSEHRRARQPARAARAPARGARPRARWHAAVPVRAGARPRRPSRRLSDGAGAAAVSVERLLDGKEICICAGSGGVGKTTDVGGDRDGHGRARDEGRRAHDRPGQAARQLARAARSSATRSGAWTPSGSPRTASRCGASCGR